MIFLYILAVIAVLFLGLLAVIYIPSPKFERKDYTPTKPGYWPTNGFKTSTALEQDMDAEKLLEMLEYVSTESKERPEMMVDSIAVIRNGYKVVDAYFNPFYTPGNKHVAHSCTKSIMSALIGIAIDQGFIKGVDVPITSFFDDRKYKIPDPLMHSVTLEDLLTMQTGIRSRDSFVYNYSGLYAAFATDDWVEYTLGLPVDAKPGTRFDYSNLSSFMLSAILQKATGKTTLAFANEFLFGPLGIMDIYWEHSPQNINIGFARMWMHPEDMAKFGLLYLQKGRWDGQQIISESWIERSLEPHAYPKNYVDALDENGKKDTKASQLNWGSLKFKRPFTDGYGYQWWLAKDGAYNALGTSGQYIMVVPEENLVVVVTSSSSGEGVFFPKKLLDRYILPAIKPNGALTRKPQAEEKIRSYEQPDALEETKRTVPAFPEIALAISGKLYKLNKNKWNMDNFRLDFTAGSDVAAFSFTAKVHDAATFSIGLDGIYRFTETPIGKFCAKGAWNSANTFVLDYYLIGYSAPVHYSMRFVEDSIHVTETSLTGTFELEGTYK